jgi:geranylgeranyl diphosphate synthase type I
VSDVDVLEFLRERALLVEREIGRWVPPDLGPEILARAARHLIEAGGKRIRPCIALTACEAVGGRPEDAVETAAAIEMLHTFTLIHDDIMDRDEFRRNVRTVHVVWGEPVAIIAGDALFAKVFEAIAANVRRLGLGGGRAAELLSTVSRASFEVCQGQALDMILASRGEVSEGDYLEMVGKKTGALMEASAKVGALLGGGTPAQVEALAGYGRLVGIAFQMRDDILGVVGDRRKFGKPIGSDLREGKRTLVVVRALSQVSGEDREAILRVLGKRDALEECMEAAIEVLRRSEAIEYVAGLAGRSASDAKSRLEVLPASEAKEMLLALADFVVQREF